MKVILIIAVILAAGVSGYFLVNPDNNKWSLFYYDNCDTCTHEGSIVLDAYDSSEVCLKAGKKASEIDLDGRAYREEDNGVPPTWECGLNCRERNPEAEKPSYICEQTVDGGL